MAAYIIDTTKSTDINLAPASIPEEILQNLYFLYSTIEYDVPLDRALGLNASYLDRPIEAAKQVMIADIYDKTEEYEPRVKINSIRFAGDGLTGILRPIVEVEINGN